MTAKDIVAKFASVSDCEMSLADIRWLTQEIEKAVEDNARHVFFWYQAYIHADKVVDQARGFQEMRWDLKKAIAEYDKFKSMNMAPGITPKVEK